MSLPSTIILDQEPIRLTAGISAQWTRTFADFPASAGWQLTYKLKPPSGSAVDIAWTTHVTANGNQFVVNVPGSLTTGFTTAGEGMLDGIVTLGTDTAQVYGPAGIFIAVRGALTKAQSMLIVIDAKNLTMAAREELEMSLGLPSGSTRHIQLMTPAQRHEERNYWLSVRANEQAAENIAAGRGNSNVIRRRYQTPT